MSGLRLGIIKPDHGYIGGFELHIAALSERMRSRGHDVRIVPVSARHRSPQIFDYPIAPVFREWHDEYFRYLELLEATTRLDLARFDSVCATQPPTYAAPHSRVFSLFYHHHRVFYDLADEFVAAGFVDSEAHKAATEAVRTLDASAIQGTRGFLSGSQTISDRLTDFWNVTSLPYRHPNVTDLPEPRARDRAGSDILCVSRQEWPKRTELFIAAMHLTAAHRSGDRPIGHLVGDGSRAEFVKSIDIELGLNPEALESLRTPEDAGTLWRNMGIFTKGWSRVEGEPSGRVLFHGPVSEDDRNRLYGESVCVVAPALDEDYGLTVLEAWQQERPVIVCSDGGGLAELVTHEINGLVVEATPFAIAQAIDRLCNDPVLGDALVAGGRDALGQISWSKAVDAFEQMAIATAGGTDPTTAPPLEIAKAPPAQPAELDAYVDEGFKQVSGWMAPAPVETLRNLAFAQERGGHVAEIGIHHGQTFILLALLCGENEKAVGFDLFENQDENVDSSGLGDRQQLEQNLRTAGVPEHRVTLATKNSLRLEPSEVIERAGGKIRLFSIDGGHTASITMNDLWIADRCLSAGGIVVLDDAFSPVWPGVGEGMHSYLRHRSCTLIPFGVVDNKTYFTNTINAAERYREVLRVPRDGYQFRDDVLYGSPMVCSKYNRII
ncbi:MAG: glycosyltransferase [Acidimicrobiales bacterium]